MTGASGQIYGVRLLELLRDIADVQTHLIVSDWAKKTLELESDKSIDYALSLADCVYDINNQAATLSSGSFKRDGMVVVPCSIKTLSAIANSYTENLIVRAADVTLKERKRLILAVRESPLHPGHLRLMTLAGEAGAVIAPPVPAFYNHPETLMDIIDHTVCRYLDLLELDAPNDKRWRGLSVGDATVAAGGRPQVCQE